jgi:hypothetical protein
VFRYVSNCSNAKIDGSERLRGNATKKTGVRFISNYGPRILREQLARIVPRSPDVLYFQPNRHSPTRRPRLAKIERPATATCPGFGVSA